MALWQCDSKLKFGWRGIVITKLGVKFLCKICIAKQVKRKIGFQNDLKTWGMGYMFYNSNVMTDFKVILTDVIVSQF